MKTKITTSQNGDTVIELDGGYHEQNTKNEKDDEIENAIRSVYGPDEFSSEFGFNSRSNPAKLIRSTYRATNDDFYLGVDSAKPVTIYLPTKATTGKMIIVKAEMSPPLGVRKITLKCLNEDLIDGYAEHSINVSNGSATLIYREGWRIIK